VAKLAKLTVLNQQTPGMPVQAFSALTGLALNVDGNAVTIDPYDAYRRDGTIQRSALSVFDTVVMATTPRSRMRNWLSSVISGGTTMVP